MPPRACPTRASSAARQSSNSEQLLRRITPAQIHTHDDKCRRIGTRCRASRVAYDAITRNHVANTLIDGLLTCQAPRLANRTFDIICIFRFYKPSAYQYRPRGSAKFVCREIQQFSKKFLHTRNDCNKSGFWEIGACDVSVWRRVWVDSKKLAFKLNHKGCALYQLF